MRHNPTIGFIGLGNMGGPMCRRLTGAGLEVIAYDLNDELLAIAVEAGAIAGESAGDCARRADIFMTSLPRPEHIEAVMAGSGGALAALRPGSIWVDTTTNRKELVIELASAAPAGVKVIDAPVTGAVDGARTGTLTLFAGGEPDAVSAVKPVLEHMGLVIECGPLGAGNVVKLVTNQLWYISAAAIGEGFATGLANGVELATLWHAIKKSVGDSFVARHDAPSIFAGHYDPTFSLGLSLKDLGLVAELNERVNADLPMTAAAQAAFSRATERYGPDVGEMHVARRIEDEAGLSMALEGDWVPIWEK